MLNKIKPTVWLIGGAVVVLVIFWHPFWHFVIEVAQGADALPGKLFK